MSRYWKAALPFLLAAVIILAAASRPVVLHIGFPCDSYWNVPGENYYTFIDAAIEKFEAEHPNVKVEYTSGIRVEEYTEWLSGQYLLGQEPDVMVILPEDFVIFSDTASLRELDPFMKQDPEMDLSDKTFDEGRVAFRPMLFSEYRSYEPYPWRIKRSSNFEWDCIAMPSGTSVGGGNYSRLSTLMLGISQRTKHSRLSWELLKTIACTEEMQTMVYTELSGVSALHSVTESDEVARLLQMDSQDTASRGMSTLPAIMEDTLATPRFARYHQAMESADRLITEAMSADKNFELQLLQIQQQLDVALTS